MGCGAHDARRLTSCFFSENSAYDGAGFNGTQSGARVEECRFIGNSAEYAGGGVELFGGTAIVADCIIAENLSNMSGGGIVVGVESAPTISG
jgi:hypothetical protein